MYVAGWGRVNDGSLPELLIKGDKPIMENIECSRYWGSFPSITDRMFCTTIEDGRDFCNSNFGSAAVRNGVQHGIVSFGTSVCGDGSSPAVYVRIEQLQIRDWITSLTGL